MFFISVFSNTPGHFPLPRLLTLAFFITAQ